MYTLSVYFAVVQVHGLGLRPPPAISFPHCLLLTWCFYLKEILQKLLLWFNSILTDNIGHHGRGLGLLPGQDPHWENKVLAGLVSLDQFAPLPSSTKWVIKSSIQCQGYLACGFLTPMKETDAAQFCDGKRSLWPLFPLWSSYLLMGGCQDLIA